MSLSSDDAYFDARDLSCMALALLVDPSFQEPTFHGYPVVNYQAEVERRGREHVTRCQVVDHYGDK